VAVKSVINLYGPSDLASYWRTAPTPAVMQEALRRYVGGSPAEAAERYRLLSPVTHVDRTAPPTISFYGASDRLVGTDQEMALENALIAADVDHETYLLPGAEHDFDANWGGLASQYTRDRLQRFLDRNARASLSR
jgi:dipeptidyl aminopeptidase/acylaminoacyl peptidase